VSYKLRRAAVRGSNFLELRSETSDHELSEELRCSSDETGRLGAECATVRTNHAMNGDGAEDAKLEVL